MINDFKQYEFYTFGNENGYGEKILSAIPQGFIKMSIFNTSQSIQDNINYKSAQYIGFTYSGEINDSFVIDYNGNKLKVLYINAQGRIKQVFLSEI